MPTRKTKPKGALVAEVRLKLVNTSAPHADGPGFAFVPLAVHELSIWKHWSHKTPRKSLYLAKLRLEKFQKQIQMPTQSASSLGGCQARFAVIDASALLHRSE